MRIETSTIIMPFKEKTHSMIEHNSELINSAENQMIVGVEDKGYIFFDTSEDVYHTSLGQSITSKYGYAEEFDHISRDYAGNIQGQLSDHIGNNCSTSVITDMEYKYNELKKRIEENYTGDEKDARTKELEFSYQYFMKHNITDPTKNKINSQMALNNLRQKFSDLYEMKVDEKGSEYANQVFLGDLSGLKDSCATIKDKLQSCKILFEQFIEILSEAHGKSEEGVSVANQLLQDINTGLFAVHKESNKANEALSQSERDDVQELWALLNMKNDMYQSIGKRTNTDEEKYKSFLDSVKSASGLDSRIDKLVEQLSRI